jgi:hypothetical protein
MSMIFRLQRPVLALAAFGAAFVLLLAGRAEAATFAVNTPVDMQYSGAMCTGSEPCSLRAAVQLADSTGGSNTIVLPQGTYALSFSSTGPDEPADGDLDIDGNASVTIQGAGSSLTKIDPAGVDRAFAVQAGSALSLSGLTIEGGKPAAASSGGEKGGAVFSEGELTVGPGVALTGNEAIEGGAVYLSNPAPGASFTGVTINANRATGGSGGGIASETVEGISLVSSVLIENEAESRGGDLFVGAASEVTSTESDYTQAAASSGGGVYVAYGIGQVTFTGGVIADNQVPRRGGGLYTESAIKVSRVTFKSNSAAERGGGLTVEAQVPMRIADSTFLDNSAEASGALDTSSYEPDGAIVNSTFYGNGATESGSAIGGYYFLGKLDLINSTIVGNVGPAPAISKMEILEPNEIGVVNSIIVGNEGGDCELPLTNDAGHNILGATCEPTTPVSTDQVGVDPMLEPLAENGGGILTMALRAKSPAIDAGDATWCPSTDERGEPRSGACDLGAYELVSTTPTSTPEPTPTPQPTPNPVVTPDNGTPTTPKGDGSPAPTPPASGAGSARYKFGIKKILHAADGGTAKLRVRYNGPGLIQLTGKRVEAVSRRTEAGVSYLPIVPNEALAQMLGERGRVHVVVMVQFTPDAGVGRIKEKPVGVWLYR